MCLQIFRLRSTQSTNFGGSSKQNQLLRGIVMPGNIFYIIGVIVVVLFILGYLGLR